MRANTTVDTGVSDAAASSCATATSRWLMLNRPRAVVPRLAAMIQVSTQTRLLATRSTADTRTPNTAMTRNCRGESDHEGRHPALRQARTPITHCETTTWLTRAHAPPPRSAVTTATAWASTAATRAWIATARKAIARLSRARGTPARTVGMIERTSARNTGTRAGSLNAAASRGAMATSPADSTRPARTEAQNAVLRLRWSVSSVCRR